MTVETRGAAATGLATVTSAGAVLDVWYPVPALAGGDVTQPDLAAAESADGGA